jgi:hypothetical protein
MEDQGWLVGNADLSAYPTRKLWKIIFRAAVSRGFLTRFLTLLCIALGNDWIKSLTLVSATTPEVGSF